MRGKSFVSARDLCLIGVAAALVAVMAQISIPMPLGVPMTLQTFAVSLAGILLGGKRGAMAVLAYVLLGAAGVPVFSGFTGGLGRIVGPTGGFLVSFPLMAWIVGRCAEGFKGGVAVGLASGIALNFLCGMAVFALATGSGIGASFAACVLPFIPTAAVSAVLAGMLGARLRRRTAWFAMG